MVIRWSSLTSTYRRFDCEPSEVSAFSPAIRGSDTLGLVAVVELVLVADNDILRICLIVYVIGGLFEDLFVK